MWHWRARRFRKKEIDKNNDSLKLVEAGLKRVAESADESTKAVIADMLNENKELQTTVEKLEKIQKLLNDIESGAKARTKSTSFSSRVSDAVAATTPLFALGRTVYRRATSSTTPKQDFISRPGQPATSFSSNDTIIGVKNPASLTGGGGNVSIYIENLSGLDAREISMALGDMLKDKGLV